MSGAPGSAARPVDTGTALILAEAADGIGWITFNQPARHNAMSLAMWAGLGVAARALGADPSVRVLVMRGAGGQAFVSGADISEFETRRADAAQKRQYDEIAAEGQQALAALAQPLIAMIQGHCLGGGLALALSADVRLADTSARFAIPAARLGLGYDYRGVAALARVVGPSAAKDILFSARALPASEALRLGLVNAVLEPDALDGHVRAYAARIADNAPLTLRAAKAAVAAFEHYADAMNRPELAAMVARCFDSDDYREGRRAFLAKRRPAFQGR